MSLQFGTFEGGRPKPIFEGYKNVQKQQTNTAIVKSNARSTIVISSQNVVTNTSEDHIYSFKPAAKEARQLKNDMRTEAFKMTNYNAVSSSLQSEQKEMTFLFNLVYKTGNLGQVIESLQMEV